MPTLNLQHSLLRHIQGINGTEHSADRWPNWLPSMGCPVEGNDDDVIEVPEATTPVEAAVGRSIERIAPRIDLHRGHQRHRAERIGDYSQVTVPSVPTRVTKVAKSLSLIHI